MENTYVIVGGSSGIGLEITRNLASDGHRVFVYSRSHQPLAGLTNVEHQHFDVLEDEGRLNNLPEIIDGLVYCPGTINLKPFGRLKETDFLHDFRVNVTGAVKVIQQTYPALLKSDQASIVLFSTVAVQLGMNFHCSIAASKGAVEGMVRSLAAEFSPKIRVNAVAPSLTDTPLATGLLSGEARRKTSAEMHPLKRYGNVTDMASAAVFLLSPASSWITGQILHVDGGMSALKV